MKKGLLEKNSNAGRVVTNWQDKWNFEVSLNTFTAKTDHSRFNFSNALFQLRRETCTAASVHLADDIFIPFIVYYAYIAI
jgi:hypothetical protein